MSVKSAAAPEMAAAECLLIGIFIWRVDEWADSVVRLTLKHPA
jgi:hypothetical protein